MGFASLTVFELVYLAAAGVAIISSTLLSLLYHETRRFTRSQMKNKPATAQGRVQLFIPVKGHDPALQKNLTAFLDQDYPDYSVVFAVEDEKDPAVAAIEHARETSLIETRLISAGLSSGAIQKAHNLLAATESLADDVQVLAFADADFCPDPDWLASLVSEVSERNVLTSYRFMVSDRPRTVNRLVCAANNAIIAMAGISRYNLIWGGSWAIRRDLFHSIGIRAEWQKASADDLAAKRCTRRTGLRVLFEPTALSMTRVDMGWIEALSFSRRQLLAVRQYSPIHYWVVTLSLTVMQTCFWLGIMIIIGGLPVGKTLYWAALVTVGILYGLIILRGALLKDIVHLLVPAATKNYLADLFFIQYAAPLAGLFGLVALWSAAFANTFSWCGVQYTVGPRGHIASIHRDP